LLVLSLPFVETIIDLLSRLTVATGCHQLGRFGARLDDRWGLRSWIRQCPVGVRSGSANDRNPENHGEREQTAAATRWDLLVELLAPVLAVVGPVVVAASGLRILIVAIVIRRCVVGLHLLAIAIVAAVVGFGPAAKTGVFLIPVVTGPISAARIVPIVLVQTRGRRLGQISRLPRVGILIAAVSIGAGARILVEFLRRRVAPARRQVLPVTRIALAPRRAIAGSRRNGVVLSD
jgi:hypothetical protein